MFFWGMLAAADAFCLRRSVVVHVLSEIISLELLAGKAKLCEAILKVGG
jgi:hypothetical protein